MASKEAKARIKINRLLEDAGWRFFDSSQGKANVLLENNVKITESHINEMGENYEKTKNGFVDFLLLDDKGFPLIVLEAKSEDKTPLVGKEQARKYAKSQNCRFVILSNGNLHYFWDLTRGNPYVITKYPKPLSVKGYKNYTPDPQKLVHEPVNDDYIVLTQMPEYAKAPEWRNEEDREAFAETNKLRFLRKYQEKAIYAIQDAVKEGQDRFLFEMATGTGKTLVAAAVIKLFLRTGNANKVLFLVDRLELEDQAEKQFKLLLKNDFKTVIYKESKDDWRKAEIVVTTVQSLLFDNKYTKLFSPTDFNLVISDESHRSIGGNARAVFEYFVGYKLGLTATPKDYLKKLDDKGSGIKDPREFERRVLLDTYRTFGCDSGQPTFRYSLIDGVRDRFLINPTVVDARTEVTTQLLSDKGYATLVINDDGEDEEQTHYRSDFEKRFFSEPTNRVFCKTFLENALRDPVSGEIGKSIVFSVSQNHAEKLTDILNKMADSMFPGKYNSDFAVQVTSRITGAQQYSINFSDKNNNLLGTANFLDTYRTSKARVCVTVGMMTTGYDCTDILNLCLMRPIFSPTDFIQIKGRGTRKHNFTAQLFDEDIQSQVKDSEKRRFKLFDFFANCEYFEEKFNYDEILKLPRLTGPKRGGDDTGTTRTAHELYERFDPDYISEIKEQHVDLHGMKIDRMFFEQFEDKVKDDAFVREKVDEGMLDHAVEYVHSNLMNKPEEYFTLDKLRRAAGVDRRLSLREIIEKIFGMIPHFKSKDELLEEEFQKFISDFKPDDAANIMPMKYFFKAYLTDDRVRDIVENKRFTELNVNPTFTMSDFKSVPKEWRSKIPEYVKDYVPLNQFMN